MATKQYTAGRVLTPSGKPCQSRLERAATGLILLYIVLTFQVTLQASSFASVNQETEKPATEEPEITAEQREFFEKRVRPVLVENCYQCHSADAKILQGGLRLDTRAGIAAGGDSGEVICWDEPDGSLLLQAIRWTDDGYQMPPDQKLSDPEIAALEKWVKMGAPDPRHETNSVENAGRVIDIEEGRKWWSFQPVQPKDVPPVADANWAQTKLDFFVNQKLQDAGFSPSPEVDRATLIRRAHLDLVGLRPSYDVIQAFVNDPDDQAYPKLIDRLLDSPQYGERWGRYWLDVVRYGEDSYTREATTPAFPFAWRYRDWVIDAINRDLPYDQFVKLQLAADLMPDTSRKDLVALGFLGAAPNYHKDGRLSKDVIETLYMDDWDERLDTVTRGFLGLTVACARCHDHKFDPIKTADYYRLASIFASTVQAPRTLNEIDPDTETRFMTDSQNIFYLSYVANLLRGDPGSKPREAREKVIRFAEQMQQLKMENAQLSQDHPELLSYLNRLAKAPEAYPDQEKKSDENSRNPDNNRARGRRRGRGFQTPMFHAVFDAGFWIDGSDPDLTMLDIRPNQPHDLHVMIGGNVTRTGELAPRGFPEVLSRDSGTIASENPSSSGRQELANRIFEDAAGLSARVFVNRVWGWHFGRPLVNTPSDFGRQGELPSHPELLEDLSARFIANGYSIKWLHREIMLSATYQQSSRSRNSEQKQDPDNRLLWRMNPRRLDFEAYRDNLLLVTGELDQSSGGPPDDLNRSENHRRTVYGAVSRGRQAEMAKLYDFPVPTMHQPQRETTTSPLQQLFVMNSKFMQERAEQLVQSVGDYPSGDQRVTEMYRRIFGRDPNKEELQLATEYLKNASEANFAQALLSTNEVIFWP